MKYYEVHSSNMKRIITPATPSITDGENDAHDLRCIGKPITLMLRSKSRLSTPSIQPWLRSPNLTSKSNVSLRTPELSLEDGKENTRNLTVKRHENATSTLPALVQKNKTPLTSSLMCHKKSKRRNQTTGSQRKKSDSEMGNVLPKMEGWSQREHPDIIIGRRTTRAFTFSYINEM
ncbi:uncharacterized protein LOC114524525 [Dendronephthya gigantea]|uniref:uncharacterized protein LOC114524525 n=1 Tax=Dendronephthya gigantea TaxID=151771 RepID=UPI00106B3E8A|nr:uncharacterized protein LOC114524525 [Dendronephthya gigantea]